MRLNSKNVEDVFMNCLFTDGENTNIHKIGEGVKTKVGFNPERLKAAESDIIDMLNDLPDGFRETSGGGMSFLNMCVTKKDYHWGEHQSVEQLVCLGNAIGKISFVLPREMWSIFPGGMPFIVYKDITLKEERKRKLKRIDGEYNEKDLWNLLD